MIAYWLDRVGDGLYTGYRCYSTGDGLPGSYQERRVVVTDLGALPRVAFVFINGRRWRP